MRPVKNSAITPMSARIDRAVRRPAIWESSYSARMSSWTSFGTPAFSSCASASASEMNGAPAARLTLAWSLVCWGTSGSLDPGQERGSERGDQIDPGQRRTDRGPEVGDRVLQATDLGALLVGHRGDGDGAELRGQRADAEADQEHRDGDDAGAGARPRRRAISTTMPANSASRPSRTTRPRGGVGEELAGSRPRRAAAVSESGSSRTPVSIGERPSATERNSGMAKKRPAWIRNWKKNVVRPPGALSRSMRRGDQRLRRRRDSGSPSAGTPRSRARREDQPDRWREADRDSGAPSLGQHPAPVGRRRMPKTISASPSAREHAPTRSSVRPRPRLAGRAARRG